jgi:hypothetical protein
MANNQNHSISDKDDNYARMLSGGEDGDNIFLEKFTNESSKMKINQLEERVFRNFIHLLRSNRYDLQNDFLKSKNSKLIEFALKEYKDITTLDEETKAAIELLRTSEIYSNQLKDLRAIATAIVIREIVIKNNKTLISLSNCTEELKKDFDKLDPAMESKIQRMKLDRNVKLCRYSRAITWLNEYLLAKNHRELFVMVASIFQDADPVSDRYKTVCDN